MPFFCLSLLEWITKENTLLSQVPLWCCVKRRADLKEFLPDIAWLWVWLFEACTGGIFLFYFVVDFEFCHGRAREQKVFFFWSHIPSCSFIVSIWMADSYFSMESKIASLSSRSVHTVIYTYFKISPLKFQQKTIRERGKKNGRNFFFVFLSFCQTATVHTGITTITTYVLVFMSVLS